ncbi:MAG: hypothetical protein IPJ66_11910 [Bacteroidetes bacterium]|nr:hypothetical protein [Bacteroidota bacterium]
MKPPSSKQATANANSLILYRQNLPANKPLKPAKQFQLSARTVDDILHNATGAALEKLKAGHYREI